MVLLVSTDRAGDITLPGPKNHGTTTLPPAALTGALAGGSEATTALTPSGAA